MRVFLLGTVFGMLLGSAVGLPSAAGSELIPETTAQGHGLSRSWFAQVQLDRARSRLQDMVLYEGALYLQTDRAALHGLDAETGRTLWTRQLPRPDQPCLPPGVQRDLLATLVGSRLYILNRYNGDVLLEVKVEGVPSAGPVLSSKWCYVPLVNGRVLAYRVEPLTDPAKELGMIKKLEDSELTPEEKAKQKLAEEEERRHNIRVRQDYIPPLICQTAGRIMAQPLLTFHNRDEEFCVWGTDEGFVNVSRIGLPTTNGMLLKSQFRAGAAVSASATYLPPDPDVVGDSGIVYVASTDGYVYAFVERSGEQLWKFSTGEPLVEPAMVIEDRVYAATPLGGMFCLDAKSGKQIWWSADVVRFLAAGKQHVYAADKTGQIRILDPKTGSWLDTMEANSLPIKMANGQTDRIYVATAMGLVQCLREVELAKPIVHGERRKLSWADEEEKSKAPVQPKQKRHAAGDDEPGARPAKRAPPKPAPAKKKPADDNAFGFGDDAGGDGFAPAPKTKKPAPRKKGPAKDAGDAPVGGDDNPFLQ